MGAAWERLVRPVLKSVGPANNFNDETLRASLMEAQNLNNSRQITFVSIDSADDDALTSNHLLLG